MQFGIFLPTARNGFLVSRNGPQFDPSFEHLRDITVLAEEHGIDFVLALTKFKGSGGDTGFWDGYVESFTLCMGLAMSTERIKVIPSASTLANHPVVVAKMLAAIDDASNGRVGLNIVTGWNKPEYVSMGLWPGDEYVQYRYDRAEEYITIVNDLVKTGHATLKGTYFDVEDADCLPVPRHPISTVCAGVSPRGARFVGEFADGSFLTGGLSAVKSTAELARQAAQDAGRKISNNAVFFVVPGETDEAAKARVDDIVAGLDQQAAANLLGLTSVDETSEGGTISVIRQAMEAPPEEGSIAFFLIAAIHGSDETIARKIEQIRDEAGLDSMMLAFIDWIDDLRWFGERIKPLIRPAAAGTPAVA